MSVSPDGKEVAFVLRGQIFVGSTEFGETRRIAEAQGHQRGVTGTGVWWESPSDSSLYFGNPELGLKDPEDVFMEKIRIDPDLLVINDPTALSQGRDQQLEAAVSELLNR